MSPQRHRRLPHTLYNPLSIAGASVAAASLVTIAFLTFVDLLQDHPPAYIGIISYVILPIPLVLGLLTIPLGVWRERRRLRQGRPASRLAFTLDLGLPRHRSTLTLFSAGTVVVLLFSAYGSYRTFEWTESVSFCGTVCHEVMEPEYVAYQNSPHARVKCVDCHVGSGAGWYVRSKLSGAYQVYAVMANVFPRPIPTPIENLRPAQETCEQCHWPSHFSAEKKYQLTYFMSDELNTRWTIGMLMKIGGGGDARGPSGGIHWHMNINNEVTYVAEDPRRQSIPFVVARNRTTGETVEYRADDAADRVEELRVKPRALMDCIDCHNRPSHIYRPPTRIVDQSLALGRISTSLPRIRAASIAVLSHPYSSPQAADDSIPLLLREFYAADDGAIAAEQLSSLRTAAEELRSQYHRNFFPRMNVRWSAYPNNIGHMTDLGCFRCHDGRHTSADGRVISKDCNSCHTILYQGTDSVPRTLTLAGLAFEHPEDIGDSWQEVNCVECHSGE